MSRTDFLGKKYLYEVLPMLKWFSEHVPGGFFIYTAAEPMTVLYVNSEVLEIYGCETIDEFKELTGYTFRGMVHPKDFEEIQASIDEQIADPKNENIDHVEYRITRKDGKVRWIDDYGHLSTFPEYGEAYYVFISDITDHKQVIEENQRMELELAKRKQFSDFKASFLFNISHEILTPMNAIMDFTDLARNTLDKPAILRRYLDKIDESNQQMLKLVNELLDMSKVIYGNTKIRMEICDLTEIATKVVDSFKDALTRKNIFVEKNIDLPKELVYTDDVNLKKILSSLLDNAIKFTPVCGIIRLTAKKKKVSDSGYVRCEFTIEDNGIGMSKEFMTRMYGAFEREENSAPSEDTGIGLGLAITKKLLDAMGGSIEVDSEKGRGSTFKIGLPVKIHRTYSLPEKFSSTVSDDEHCDDRILFVDDVELNRMLVETILEESGFSVETVPDGCDAVEAVKNHPAGYYDLVLMDIQMPIMNGYEATRTIRALDRPDAKTLPIIALSVNSGEKDRLMSIQSGMNYHIAKPFDVVQLIATINKYINKRES